MSFSRPRQIAIARDVLIPDFGDEINVGCTLWAPFNEGAGTGAAAQPRCIITNEPARSDYGGGSTTELLSGAPTPGGGHYYSGSGQGYGATWYRAKHNRTPDTYRFALSIWYRSITVNGSTDTSMGFGIVGGGTGWSSGCGVTFDGNATQRNFKFWPLSYTGYAATGLSTDLGSTSEWYHIVGVRNGPDAYIYINGALRGTYTPGSTASSFTADYVGIAGGAGGGYPITNGRWHDFRVWGRALSDSEVRRLYVERGNCGLLMPRRRIYTPAAAAASNHNIMPMMGVGD